jgi:hypothetical protein
MKKSLWEILIPANSNKGKEFSLEHHQKWDEKARAISGGLTILKTGKGEWTSPSGKIFYDKMIPVRVYCTEKEIDSIIDFTIKHYNQEAVMAYEISRNVKIVERKP